MLLSRLRIAELSTELSRAAKGAANNNHGQGHEGFHLVLLELETTEDHHQAYVQLAEEQGSSQEYSQSVGHPAPSGAELPERQALGRAEGKAAVEGETEDHKDTLVLEARRGAPGRNREGGHPFVSREGGSGAQGGGGGQRQSGKRDRGLRWEVEHSYAATEGGRKVFERRVGGRALEHDQKETGGQKVSKCTSLLSPLFGPLLHSAE